MPRNNLYNLNVNQPRDRPTGGWRNAIPRRLNLSPMSMSAGDYNRPRRRRNRGGNQVMAFAVQSPYRPPSGSTRSGDYIGPGRGPK